ncbi:MAG: TolC family protein [Dokdonella sp.]
MRQRAMFFQRHAAQAGGNGVLPFHAAVSRIQVCACVALLPLLLAACAHYEPRPLPPEQTVHAFAARRLDAPPLREALHDVLPEAAAAWPPASWNRADLLAVALVQNPQLAIARAETLAALAKEASAAETPNPELTLQSEYARDEAHSWLYGLAFDFVLRTPARRRLDVGIAQLATARARWQVVEQTWTVRRAVTSALNDAEYARRRGDLLERLVDAQQQLVALQEQRIKAGEDAPGERVVAHSALLEIEQQRAQAHADATAAQAALAAALGMPPEAIDGLRLEWPDWGAPTSIDAATLQHEREQALLSRADLAAAIGDYASAEKQLERAVARQYPEFHLDPGYYWDHGVAKWPFDIAFSPSIFNRNQGEIAEARAAREVAGQRMLAVQAEIYGAIAAATRAEAIAAQNVDAARQRVDAANELSRHAELGLKLGAIDRGERLGSDTIALHAELDALQARAQHQSARNALEDALHAPLSGPELALRSALQAAAPTLISSKANPP